MYLYLAYILKLHQ